MLLYPWLCPIGTPLLRRAALGKVHGLKRLAVDFSGCGKLATDGLVAAVESLQKLDKKKKFHLKQQLAAYKDVTESVLALTGATE